MKIAGIVKNSFVDYPGYISTVIFAPGCNMNCWYCHNAGIHDDGTYSLDSILTFLNERKNFIDAVVFSGGEITLQPDLKDVITTVKDMGFLIKLDTNGLNPKILKDLVSSKLVDYVAMDIKAPLSKYEQITRVKCDIDAIKESVEFLLSGKVEYEFRTTFSPDLSHSDIKDIANFIHDADRFYIQQYRTECYSGMLEPLPHPKEYVLQAVEIAKPFVKKCDVRGF